MNFLDFLKNNIVIFDGGMGTLLQKKGITPGELPERWNITNPDVIKNIHREYFDAGSNVVTTNTFGANILKFSEEELDLIIKSAITNAKAAMEESSSKKQKFIALDIGPLGKLLKPYGTLDFEDAVNVFSKTIILGTKYGADLIIIETMNDSYETKAALLAAKENSTLPVVVSNAYGEDGKLMTGASPKAMVALLEGMGADCIGLNCSLGPKQLAPVVEEYLKYSSLPVILQPNAGLPKSVDGTTVFDITADEFANEVALSVSKGVRVVGGCCGTTPEYIKAVAKAIKGIIPFEITKKNNSLISSYTNAVEFGDKPVLIGERINPTGKKLLKEALRNNDINYILNEAIKQQEKNVHVLDVNVGLPEIDEATLLKNAVFEIQSICDLPLQIDTASPDAMEKALRIYNGKPLINSVNGKEESMRAIFPLAKKYGGMVVALTLDENGIPKTATERFKIAKKILTVAAEYGIDKKDLIFDTLTMPVSADKNAAKITLEALEMINRELGCLTSLGVSNVSFGLPNRDTVNGTFFAQALTKGLSAAIMNPFSQEMLRVYYSFNALNGFDNNCADYISFAENDVQTMVVAAATPSESKQGSTDLQNAIIKGLKDKAAKVTKELLSSTAPLDIVQNEIIPALDTVGVGFEKSTVYLPQLLMSAEAAKFAFEVIKIAMSGASADKGTIILATVEGDIHDIGKNIVKLLLENYGFNVIDLGKDVKPQIVVDSALYANAKLVGLSALMTTTVPAMERTIKLLNEKVPSCKVVVGGAVLTEKYAKNIGADCYAKDAMETVRYAEKVFFE